ncbi:phosphoenolpyruvate synthase [Paenibacillus sp. MER TA 81-3]|uniref:phosphoenolpyruvate synthase n=1 Tax=Paenibacillus sp. MER TA 81-3 TaxID=2939573 RepID=UPI00203AEAFE|nr:phosphoenolpyruvate synthase [Paenibacillus sp. MER TA 81-3]MCM3339840.1 phosphoenolpyruvate synthase [Paenibacillus sp. MER TA 81-3]
MLPYVMYLEKVNRSHLQIVGGKGSNLGELLQAGFSVPPGFCLATSAYDAVVGQSARMESFYEELDRLSVQDMEEIRRVSRRMQQHIIGLAIPSDLIEDILGAWRELGDHNVYAVRSSATAEDLPTASFAGQQDTFLNVKGERQLLDAIRQCWSSLFSERALAYRMKNGFDHRSVRLAVIIQHLIVPDVSGVMFTADPITGNRSMISIDASFGLGEALVSGLVNPDLYQVRQGVIVKRQVSCKNVAVLPLAEGGTVIERLPEQKQNKQALSDEEIVELARLGEQIQAHYGSEQDIEWCLSGGQFFIVQARPITSIFPIPNTPNDGLHVYFSFGHLQMMTDVMSPAGISIWKIPTERASVGDERVESLVEAGGRLFVDITNSLQYNLARKVMLRIIDKMDALIGSAARQILDRFPIKEGSVPDADPMAEIIPPLATQVLKDMLEGDGQAAYAEVEENAERRVEMCRQRMNECGGAEKITFIQQNCQSLFESLMRDDFHYMMASVVAQHLLELLAKWWTFDDGELITLNKSLPFNVTGEMGMELGDLADRARAYPELAAYLRNAAEDGFMEGLDTVSGGSEFKSAFEKWLERYGARCPGEIDIVRTRWSERPYMLISSIVGHLDSVKHGEHRERFRQGELEADAAARRILSQVRSMEDGAFKERIVSRLITVYRSFMGLREHHKFVLVRHFELYRRAVIELGDDLAARGVLFERNDIFFLTLPEMKDVITGTFEQDVQLLIAARKDSFKHYQRLQPPRVITSEGEIIEGRLDGGNAPEGSLIGIPVSPGIVEGRARVVIDPSTAALKEGEILVAPFTDPGWTPLFQQAKGIVTEIGGMMTHGAVIAREYGMPAVVGIEHATTLIRDGALIRLDGTKGHVLVLKEAHSMA